MLKKVVVSSICAVSLVLAAGQAPAAADGTDWAAVDWPSGYVAFQANEELLRSVDASDDMKYVRARLWRGGNIVATLTAGPTPELKRLYLDVPAGTYYLQLCNVSVVTGEIMDCSAKKPVVNR